jgi:hypothetical protein
VAEATTTVPGKVLHQRVGGSVVRLKGQLAGRRVFVASASASATDLEFSDRPASMKRSATVRSHELLSSMLDRRQRAERRTTQGLFWEYTEIGWFRLGAYADIRFRPNSLPTLEQSICVITDRSQEVPWSDTCANLLLALRADPAEFLQTGVMLWADTTGRDPDELLARRPHSDVIERIEVLRKRRSADWRAGSRLSAAFRDFTIASLFAELDETLVATHHGIRSLVVLHAFASLLETQAERDRWFSAHQPVVELVMTLVEQQPDLLHVEDFVSAGFAEVRHDMLVGRGIDQAQHDVMQWVRNVHLVRQAFSGAF